MGALLFLTIFAVCGIAAMTTSPKYALYLYIFVYFCMNERVNWWITEIPTLKWSLLATVILVISCIIHAKKRDKEINIAYCAPLKWLIAFFLLMIALLPFVVYPDISSVYVYYFFRYIVAFIIIIIVIDDWSTYKWFVWLYLSGCFYFSFYAYQFPIRVNGRLEGIGPPDANDSNMLAALLVTTIPFIVNRIINSSWLIRIVSIVYLVFIMNAIILCSSRGAIIGIIVSIGIYVIFEENKKIKLGLLLGSILSIFAFFYLSDDVVFVRLSTLRDPSVEGSGGRVAMWAYVFNMFKDYPFGAGGRSIAYMSPRYLPEYMLSNNGLRAAHNTFLTVLVEQGFLGLFLFLGFLSSTFRGLHKLRTRLVVKLNSDNVLDAIKDIYMDAGALISSLAGLLVCSFFIDRIYFEPLYWLCALSCVLVGFSRIVDTGKNV